MATAEPRYPGVPKVLVGGVRDFAQYGLVFGVGGLIFSLPALVFALLVYPPMASYVLLSVTMLAITLGGKYVRGYEPESDPLDGIELGDLSPFDTVLVIGTFYVLIAGSLSGALIWTAVLAAYAGFVLALPTVAIVIALGYPIFDRWIAHREARLSVVVISANAIVTVLNAVYRALNISRDILDTAKAQTASIY